MNIQIAGENGRAIKPQAGMHSPVLGLLMKRVRPEYPEQERRSYHQGKVAVYAVIDGNGQPTDLQIALTVSPGLDRASVYAVRQWRSEPAVCNDEPVEVQGLFEVNYTLQ